MCRESSITRALFCQEIIDSIFSHLSLNSVVSRYDHTDHLRGGSIHEVEQRKRLGALASAARVSKHISEAALSILWAQLDSFSRLFRILPQYTLRWDMSEDWSIEEPTEADWIRLEKYAMLVREAYCFYVRSDELKVWEIILNRYHSASRFLPRLTSLAMLHATPADTLIDLPLLLPTLRHLTIRLDTSQEPSSDGGAVLTKALERIIVEIPTLSSLRIKIAPQEPAQISWRIASFQSLRKLDITDYLSIDTTILAAIGQFYDLRTLSINVGVDCSHVQGCFQALAELNIGGRANHIQSFLAATSPPRLQSLSLRFVQDPSTGHLMQCMSSLSTTVPKTLFALTLDSKLEFTPPLASVQELIQPTLAFRELSDFVLKFRPLPSVSDTQILTMVAAWPTLATLRIAHDHTFRNPASPQGPARPTALLFPLIAARCPHLDTLELPEVDLAATPALDALPPPPPGGHSLRALDMAREVDVQARRDRRSNLSGADRRVSLRTAVMLDRLFPRMELPGLRGAMGDEGEEKGWAGVVRLLHAMRAGREHGEAFEKAGCGEDLGGGDESGESEDDRDSLDESGDESAGNKDEGEGEDEEEGMDLE